jgi:hypothetical protein
MMTRQLSGTIPKHQRHAHSCALFIMRIVVPVDRVLLIGSLHLVLPSCPGSIKFILTAQIITQLFRPTISSLVSGCQSQVPLLPPMNSHRKTPVNIDVRTGTTVRILGCRALQILPIMHARAPSERIWSMRMDHLPIV